MKLIPDMARYGVCPSYSTLFHLINSGRFIRNGGIHDNVHYNINRVKTFDNPPGYRPSMENPRSPVAEGDVRKKYQR